MTRAPDQRLADALALAAAGVPVFPTAPDKRPRVRWRDAATRDPDVLRQWWRDWPDSLPAVPTGAPSGIWVADLDVSGDGEPVGERSAATLGIVPQAHPCAIRTRRGGWHLPYRWRPDLPRNTARRLPGIDTRGDGGFVVAWDPAALAAAAADQNLPEPPAALVAALAPEPPPKVNGHDAVTISDRYVAAALDAECRAVGATPEGMRNITLNRAAFNLGQLVGAHALGRADAERSLLAAALACGLPHPEAQATIRSGLDAGAQHPRRIDSQKPVERDRPAATTHPAADTEDSSGEFPEPASAVVPEAGSDTDALPDLIVNYADLTATARALRDILAARPMLFDRGGPVRLHHNHTRSGLVATPLTVEGVCIEAHACCQPVVFVQQKGTEEWTRKRTTLPDRVARLYLAMNGDHALRPLSAIASTPVLADDGSISAGEGYDQRTGMFRERCPDLAVPARPSRADAEAALLHLRGFLRTFCFADAHRDGDGFTALAMPPGQDESAALVALLTAICRPSLHLVPALLIRAPAISGAGTGKGLLARTITAIAFGRAPLAMPPGHDADELDKRICGAAITAEPVILIDNANARTLRSDTLAALITERPARIRPLGKSTLTPITTAILPIVTGNGVQLSEDLARRFLVVELDALTEDPEARAFAGNPAAEAETHRAALLAAALTVWRWGRQNAAARRRGRPLGSFETWAAWCRDPLLTLGCADPVERVADVKAEDPQRKLVAEVFAAWWDAHADTPMKAADLADPVKAALDPQGRGRQYLASRVQKLAGTRCGGFAMTAQRGGGQWSVTTYQLRRGGDPLCTP